MVFVPRFTAFKRLFSLILIFSVLIAASVCASAAPANEEEAALTLSKYGSSGEEVRQIQTKLKASGYYTGAVDGIYGAKTRDAVKAFSGTAA